MKHILIFEGTHHGKRERGIKSEKISHPEKEQKLTFRYIFFEHFYKYFCSQMR